MSFIIQAPCPFVTVLLSYMSMTWPHNQIVSVFSQSFYYFLYPFLWLDVLREHPLAGGWRPTSVHSFKLNVHYMKTFLGTVFGVSAFKMKVIGAKNGNLMKKKMDWHFHQTWCLGTFKDTQLWIVFGVNASKVKVTGAKKTTVFTQEHSSK